MRRKLIINFIPFLLLIGLCSCGSNEGNVREMKKTSSNNIQIQTDTTPIYNHFPTLPETKKIEWYSEISDGIGPSTIELYIFASYDTSEKIDSFLQTVTISDEIGTGDFNYSPGIVDENEKWHEILDVPFCFQEGIPKTSLMNTKVYVNNTHTMLFVYAIGE